MIDPTTGSILIQASFPNPTRLLRPGLYAKVRILQHTENDAIVIPERCIIELQGKFFVYLINEKNEIENRSITPGYRLGDLRLISQGLKKGDKVVIDALQKVKPGIEVKPVESEFKSKTLA